jgi:uncharacterized protein
MDPIINFTEPETRSYEVDQAELRADINSRMVEGYAILFNSESKLIENRFTEIIEPSAMNGVIERSDVLALIDHTKAKGVLARSTKGVGSLKLSIDKRGVKYSFEAPKYSLGDELLEGIKRGDIRSSSFGFFVSSGQKWEKKADGSYLRRVTQIDLLVDVSPTYREAYQGSTVALRNLDFFISTENIAVAVIEPVLEKTTAGEPITDPVKRSDDERYARQLNYSLKQLNK